MGQPLAFPHRGQPCSPPLLLTPGTYARYSYIKSDTSFLKNRKQFSISIFTSFSIKTSQKGASYFFHHIITNFLPCILMLTGLLFAFSHLPKEKGDFFLSVIKRTVKSQHKTLCSLLCILQMFLISSLAEVVRFINKKQGFLVFCFSNQRSKIFGTVTNRNRCRTYLKCTRSIQLIAVAICGCKKEKYTNLKKLKKIIFRRKSHQKMLETIFHSGFISRYHNSNTM